LPLTGSTPLANPLIFPAAQKRAATASTGYADAWRCVQIWPERRQEQIEIAHRQCSKVHTKRSMNMPTNDNDPAYWTTKMVEEVYSILTSREQIAVEAVAVRKRLTVDQLLVWALLKSGTVTPTSQQQAALDALAALKAAGSL
jgi:hypothetical protein